MLESSAVVAVNGVPRLVARNAQTDHAHQWLLARAAKSGGSNLGNWNTFVMDVYTGGPEGPSTTPPLHSAYTARQVRLLGNSPSSGAGVRWVFTNTATEAYTPTRFSLFPVEKSVDGTNVIGWFEPQAGASSVGQVLAGDTLTVTWEITAAITGGRDPSGATFTEEGSSQATALLTSATQLQSVRNIFDSLRTGSAQPLRNFKLELFTTPQSRTRPTDFTDLERLTYGGSSNDGVLTATPSLVREVAGTSGTEVDLVEVRFDIPLPATATRPYVYRFGTSTRALQTGLWNRLRIRTSPADTEPAIFPLTGYK